MGEGEMGEGGERREGSECSEQEGIVDVRVKGRREIYVMCDEVIYVLFVIIVKNSPKEHK